MGESAAVPAGKYFLFPVDFGFALVLAGSIPPVLGILAALRNLNLCHNQLSGESKFNIQASHMLLFEMSPASAHSGFIPKTMAPMNFA